MKKKIKEELYPIKYEGIEYKKEDCDPLFVSLYVTKYQLNYDSAIYLGEHMYVCPDGSIYED